DSNDEKLRLATLSSLAGAWPGNGAPLDVPVATAGSDFNVGAASLTVAPVYQGREVAGALTVSAGSPHSFSDHDRTALRLMSGLLSHALRKAGEELRPVQSDAIKLTTIEEVRHSTPAVTVPANRVPQPEPNKIVAVSKPPRTQSSLSFQTAFRPLQASIRSLRPAVHIRYGLRALRSAAIAPPVWLLVIVAVLLVLETWRNEPFNSAQATSTRDLAGDFSTKRTEPASLQRPIPPSEVSHMRATDPDTAAIVGDLSRFEIRSLRRQAQFGDDSAAFTLGMAYETGRYLPQSCWQAAQWVAMAAGAGNPAA